MSDMTKRPTIFVCQDEEASARMKVVKPDTTAPIYVPLSEYKDPDNNCSIASAATQNASTAKEPGDTAVHGQITYSDKTFQYHQEQEVLSGADRPSTIEYGNVENIRQDPLGDSALQTISSTVAAVLQAAENSHQPSLHTLAAAAMMPQSLHPMYNAQPMQQQHSGTTGLQPQDGSSLLPTASCFFGQQQQQQQQSLPPQPQSDLHLQSQAQQPALSSQPNPQQLNQQQTHFSIPSKFDNLPHPSAPYLDKFEDRQNEHGFPQV